MTDPGRLNRRLVLEAPVETADGAGGVARSYATVTTLWALLEPASARGDVVGDRLGTTVTHRILIRFRPDVTTRHRFRSGARTFRIVAILEHDKRTLEIRAEERID